jgi:transcriptional regulator with XRE-family HTH domain
METTTSSFGELLRDWRQRRRVSQLDLATEAEISQRHLSFVESGRAMPSRDMVLRLSEHLDVPLRERNVLLTAAGFAPVYPLRPLSDPSLIAAKSAVDLLLAGHMPHPALAVDRAWTLLAANAAVQHLIATVSPVLLKPPVNVLRLSLHPQGLAPQIINAAEWRAHVLTRLQRQIAMTADAQLIALYGELKAYPLQTGGVQRPPKPLQAYADVFVPLQLNYNGTVLSFLSTTTIFGTPLDVTVSEIAIESFFPADAATTEAMRQMMAATS